MIKIYQSLLVLGILLYDISEGCGRVPATPPPAPSSTPALPTQKPNRNETTETIQGEDCTEDERNRTRCYTGQGVCFVYIINYQRKASCHCNERYTGKRCEELNFDILFPSTEDGVATAGIAASVAVAVVVAVVLIGVGIVYIRRKRKREKERSRPVNGNPLLPENHTVSDVSGDLLQQPRKDMQFNSNGKYFLCEEKEKKQMYEFRTTSV